MRHDCLEKNIIPRTLSGDRKAKDNMVRRTGMDLERILRVKDNRSQWRMTIYGAVNFRIQDD